jgi:hypothetical protein
LKGRGIKRSEGFYQYYKIWDFLLLTLCLKWLHSHLNHNVICLVSLIMYDMTNMKNRYVYYDYNKLEIQSHQTIGYTHGMCGTYVDSSYLTKMTKIIEINHCTITKCDYNSNFLMMWQYEN